MPTRTSEGTAKKAKATASSGKGNALQRPLQPSEALAAVVGPGPLPRGEVVSKVWEYIKFHNLQNPELDFGHFRPADRLGTADHSLATLFKMPLSMAAR
jgi:chromatin remodeling complex protein RSC6